MDLRESVEQLFGNSEFSADDRIVFEQFKTALRRGVIRSAEKDAYGNWHANAWVKQGILLGFRMGKMVEMSQRTEAVRIFLCGDVMEGHRCRRRVGSHQ